MMSGIGSKDTKPELVVRHALHKRGYRYRLHDRKLPGRPDLVFSSRRAVIQVNGCFWHGHNCNLFKWPSTRIEFWKDKIQGNQERDSDNLRKLAELDWRCLTVWECALKGREKIPLDEVIDRISQWLDAPGAAQADISGVRKK